MYHITMKDHTTPEQTEFDFNESVETERQRLEREVLAAGGRIGKKDGNFTFSFDESEGYKRGDEHREIRGLFYFRRDKKSFASRWVDAWVLDDKALEHKRYYEVNKEKVAEGQKRYREENREKVAEAARRYYEENREKIAEGKRRYREENREKEVEYQKMWREENREKEAERKKRWREENRERVAEVEKRYRDENKDKVRAGIARRRAKLREALGPSASKAIIESRYAAKEHLKKVTGYDWHVDHTQPLSRGGKEHEDNLQVVPAKWNCSKGNHHCDRWIEDSDIYRYATAVEARFEREAKKNEKR